MGGNTYTGLDITSLEADPANPNTVYVTLGGFANRQWVPPGSYLDPNDELGEGHVFKSTDAGKTFTNISGNLPNVHANLPVSPVTSLQFKPDNPDFLIVSTFGRGVYSYDFDAARRPQAACDDAFVPDPGFDDISGNTHQGSIECIAWYLIAQGKGDIDDDGNDEYDPSGPVTRGQMASYLVHLAIDGGLDVPVDPEDAFSDTDDTVHKRNINALAQMDLVQGIGRGRYDPEATVTRAQMATFIGGLHDRITGALPADAPDTFNDDDGHVHETSINALAELDIVRGFGGGEYRPGQPVARGQMATFVINDLVALVDGDFAYAGGANVDLDSESTAVGGDLTGTIEVNKDLIAVLASGCGLDDEEVEVADDGRFELTLPASQAAGTCELSIRTETTNRDARGEIQAIAYGFAITVT